MIDKELEVKYCENDILCLLELGGLKMKNVRIDTRKNLIKKMNENYTEHGLNGYTKIDFAGGYHLLTIFGEKAIFQDFSNNGKMLAQTVMPLSDILKII